MAANVEINEVWTEHVSHWREFYFIMTGCRMHRSEFDSRQGQEVSSPSTRSDHLWGPYTLPIRWVWGERSGRSCL